MMELDEAIKHCLEVAEMKTVNDFKWEMYHCYPTSEYESCTHPAICCHMNYLAISMLLRGEY